MLWTFYLLVITHIIADFALQPSVIAIKKRGLNKYMLAHGAIMALAFYLPLINYPARNAIIGSLAVFVLHVPIDALIVEAKRWLKVGPKSYYYWAVFGIDQALHVTILFVVFNYLVIGNIS